MTKPPITYPIVSVLRKEEISSLCDILIYNVRKGLLCVGYYCLFCDTSPWLVSSSFICNILINKPFSSLNKTSHIYPTPWHQTFFLSSSKRTLMTSFFLFWKWIDSFNFALIVLVNSILKCSLRIKINDYSF